jgi:hypothetical protein
MKAATLVTMFPITPFKPVPWNKCATEHQLMWPCLYGKDLINQGYNGITLNWISRK